MVGVLLALCAAAGFGATAFFARLSIQHVRPTTGVIVSLIVGAAATSVFAVAMDGTNLLSLGWIAFALIFLAGIASFVCGRLFNFISVSKIGVSKSSPVVGASPLFAVTMAVLIAGESPNLLIITGAAAIVVGVAVVVSR